MGGCVYTFHIPERFAPGKFDYVRAFVDLLWLVVSLLDCSVLGRHLYGCIFVSLVNGR